mmetsp:Transcript_25738/g.57898  ORF Transcript_25738/g.57898 Transcript_25738/m.57898 type:complete len:220 (+) Transcript_25738:4122-4781(+)
MEQDRPHAPVQDFIELFEEGKQARRSFIFLFHGQDGVEEFSLRQQVCCHHMPDQSPVQLELEQQLLVRIQQFKDLLSWQQFATARSLRIQGCCRLSSFLCVGLLVLVDGGDEVEERSSSRVDQLLEGGDGGGEEACVCPVDEILERLRLGKDCALCEEREDRLVRNVQEGQSAVAQPCRDVTCVLKMFLVVGHNFRIDEAGRNHLPGSSRRPHISLVET